MRWDQAHWAALLAAGVAAFGLISNIMSDGHVSGAEAWTLVVAFGTTFFAYIKDHPAKADGDYVTPPGSKG